MANQLYTDGQEAARHDSIPRWETDALWTVLPPAFRLGYVDQRIHA
jgi:hypothetical protein